MSLASILHDIMDNLFDSKEAIFDKEHMDVCSTTNDSRSLLVIKGQYDDYEIGR